MVASGLEFFAERMAGLPVGGHDGYGYSEYALIFPVAVLGLIVGLARGRNRWGYVLCLVWLLVPLLTQLVWPSLVGEAAASRRLAQHLHLALAPAAVAAGTLWSRRSWLEANRRRVISRVVLVIFAALTLKDAARMTETYRDAMSDQRAAYRLLSGFEGQIASDAALCQFFVMKDRFRSSSRCLVVDDVADVSARMAIVIGGSRRPELDPALVAGLGWQTPVEWVRLGRLPGSERPWRRQRGLVLIAQ